MQNPNMVLGDQSRNIVRDRASEVFQGAFQQPTVQQPMAQQPAPAPQQQQWNPAAPQQAVPMGGQHTVMQQPGQPIAQQQFQQPAPVAPHVMTRRQQGMALNDTPVPVDLLSPNTDGEFLKESFSPQPGEEGVHPLARSRAQMMHQRWNQQQHDNAQQQFLAAQQQHQQAQFAAAQAQQAGLPQQPGFVQQQPGFVHQQPTGPVQPQPGFVPQQPTAPPAAPGWAPPQTQPQQPPGVTQGQMATGLTVDERVAVLEQENKDLRGSIVVLIGALINRNVFDSEEHYNTIANEVMSIIQASAQEEPEHVVPGVNPTPDVAAAQAVLAQQAQQAQQVQQNMQQPPVQQQQPPVQQQQPPVPPQPGPSIIQ